MPGAGNLQSVKLNGAVTDTYGYTDENWRDKLTSYNGQAITYDGIGNPLTYRDGITFGWTNGRKVAEFNNEAYHISYLQNEEGIRRTKTVTNKQTGETKNPYL